MLNQTFVGAHVTVVWGAGCGST